jgi:hypothetical protein
MFYKVTKSIFSLPGRIAVGLINVYQVLLSPDHSWLKSRFPHGYCRFYPSCSQYAKESIIKFGVVKGVWFGTKRVSRCNPWASPAIDKV